MKTGNSRIDNYQGPWIVGSDEAGLGAWAGELLVAAVGVPRDWTDTRVTDSKALSERQREALFDEYRKSPCIVAAAEAVSPQTIDQKGVYQALIQAHTRAIQRVLAKCPDNVLVVADGNLPLAHTGAISLPKADALVPACSLASIFAKVIRDRLTPKWDRQYPGYDFVHSRGYGTPKHQEALRRLGPCPIHRKSYSPIKRLLKHSIFPVLNDISHLD